MSFEDGVNIYFVRTDSGDAVENDDDFHIAENYLRDHITEDRVRHLKASEVYPLIASGVLTKKDVFIFDRFEGDCFEQLQKSTKSLIIGPRCLKVCIIKNVPIPPGNSPVFTTAMRNLKISATGISSEEKDKLSRLIHWMGGYYFQNFGRTVTHLISNTIKSTKYEHATMNGIPVMHVDWVQRVWERSSADDVSAVDKEFDKYRLPILFGTNITCTGLDTTKKNEVMRLVNENGGTYHRAFRSQLVDIVITEKDKTDSDKYQAAVRYKKDILLPDWVFDSVERGFALPTKNYQIKSLKVSTPTKFDQSIADFTTTDHTQLSDISRISSLGSARSLRSVNETISSVLNGTKSDDGPNTFVAPQPIKSAQDTGTSNKNLQRDILKKSLATNTLHYRLVFDEISPKLAKKAGNFLDGCCIYLSGFRADEREKLNRILNVGGATRYDAVNEDVTHIIVGELDDNEFKDWKKNNLLSGIHIVRLDWLLESIKLKQPANENVYRVSLPTRLEPDAPSPSSKKTLRSMNHSFRCSPDISTKKKLFHGAGDNNEITNIDGLANTLVPSPAAASTELPLAEEEHNLLAQYSQENVAAMPSLPPAKQQLTPSTATAITNQKTPSVNASPSTNKTGKTDGEKPTTSNSTEITGYTIDYERLDFFKNVAIFVDKNHFSDEFYTEMLAECEAAKGSIVSNSFRDPVDYVIVSFERTVNADNLPVHANYIVTELYVESCIRENKLVPIEYFHKHIPHTADAQPLVGMTIVISAYSGLERDFINSIAQLLGAKINDAFIKKEAPLLICPKPSGAKYDGAIKWRFPIVTSDWLVDCANQGKKLPYISYLVGDSNEDFPLPTPPSNKCGFEPPKSVEPPKVTPLRNKRVSELAGSTPKTTYDLPTARNSPESPHTPLTQCGRASYNFDYMENILAEINNEDDRKYLRELINDIRNNPTPELDRIRRQACTPINRKVPTPKGVPDFCNTPEFRQRLVEECEKRWHLPTKRLKPDTPIDVIRRRLLLETCRAMGIPCVEDDTNVEQATATSVAENESNIPALHANVSNLRKQLSDAKLLKTRLDTDCTPLQRKATKRSIAQTRTLMETCQTPLTSSRSARNASSTSDTYVPNTQDVQEDPQNASISGLGQRASILGKSSINFDRISFEETDLANNAENVTNRPSSAAKNSAVKRVCTDTAGIAKVSPELKQISEYVNRRQSLMKRAPPKPTLSEMMEMEERNIKRFESEPMDDGNSENMVDWRDPRDFQAEKRSVVLPPMQYNGTPRFSISCADTIPEDIINKILKLNGTVSENLVNFDPDCTHFVCERPNRAEKILGCISSGKWVLGLGYIEESFARDAFIDEELYEWGNCKAVNLPQLSPDDQVIARAAHNWRQRLTASGQAVGAFSGFRVILRIPTRNIESLKTVIKAGQGEIIDAVSPYSESNRAHLATHCFVDVKKMPLTQSEYNFLKQHNVRIATQFYINGYLMNGPDADFSKYEINM